MELEPLNASAWYGDNLDVEGRTTLEKPTARQLAQIGAAEAAGALRVKASKDERAKMSAAVESDAESLKNQERAMADGSWHRGAHEAFIVYARHLLDNGHPGLSASNLGHQITVSKNYLEHVDELGHEAAIAKALGQDVTDG